MKDIIQPINSIDLPSYNSYEATKTIEIITHVTGSNIHHKISTDELE